MLGPWLHRYDYHRAHTALGGHPPASRVSNLPGNYPWGWAPTPSPIGQATPVEWSGQ